MISFKSTKFDVVKKPILNATLTINEAPKALDCLAARCPDGHISVAMEGPAPSIGDTVFLVLLDENHGEYRGVIVEDSDKNLVLK